jgi:hypothetical protein
MVELVKSKKIGVAGTVRGPVSKLKAFWAELTGDEP